MAGSTSKRLQSGESNTTIVQLTDFSILKLLCFSYGVSEILWNKNLLKLCFEHFLRGYTQYF